MNNLNMFKTMILVITLLLEITELLWKITVIYHSVIIIILVSVIFEKTFKAVVKHVFKTFLRFFYLVTEEEEGEGREVRHNEKCTFGYIFTCFFSIQIFDRTSLKLVMKEKVQWGQCCRIFSIFLNL